MVAAAATQPDSESSRPSVLEEHALEQQKPKAVPPHRRLLRSGAGSVHASLRHKPVRADSAGGGHDVRSDTAIRRLATKRSAEAVGPPERRPGHETLPRRGRRRHLRRDRVRGLGAHNRRRWRGGQPQPRDRLARDNAVVSLADVVPGSCTEARQTHGLPDASPGRRLRADARRPARSAHRRYASFSPAVPVAAGPNLHSGLLANRRSPVPFGKEVLPGPVEQEPASRLQAVAAVSVCRDTRSTDRSTSRFSSYDELLSPSTVCSASSFRRPESSGSRLCPVFGSPFRPLSNKRGRTPRQRGGRELPG